MAPPANDGCDRVCALVLSFIFPPLGVRGWGGSCAGVGQAPKGWRFVLGGVLGRPRSRWRVGR